MPVLRSIAVEGHHLLSSLQPGRQFVHKTSRDLAQAISDFHINFIVPGDELAVALMQRVYRLDGENFPSQNLIRHSLGGTATRGITYSKVYINSIATKLNIDMPKKLKLDGLNPADFPVV